MALIFTSHKGEKLRLNPLQLSPATSPHEINSSSPIMDAMRASVIDGFNKLDNTLSRAGSAGDGSTSPPEQMRQFIRSISTPGRDIVPQPHLLSPLFTMSMSTEVPDSPPKPISRSVTTPILASQESTSPLVKAAPSPPPVTKGTKLVPVDTAARVPQQLWITKNGREVEATYNEYGELVEDGMEVRAPIADLYSVTELLRKIREEYHHKFQAMLKKVFMPRANNEETDEATNLTSWIYVGRSASITSTPEGVRLNAATYQGPPRLLEGCGDGSWMLMMKKEHPNWTIEGLDDTNHWSCLYPKLVARDFMHSGTPHITGDYFGQVPSTQSNDPEFTVRNINHILAHDNPFPTHLYDIIRARDIFDRVENFKSFLDTLRLLLKPGGVIEFLELDPRPRIGSPGPPQRSYSATHRSHAATTFTDNIPDRFIDPRDHNIATNVPGWFGRVEARLKARIRQSEAIAAPNLKSWLEGAGFWDVKQTVTRIPVGGETQVGKLLLEFIMFQNDNEDTIPKLKSNLPVMEKDEVASGAYYLNLHTVTGRRPQELRTGHLLSDGSRQELPTESKYSALIRASMNKNDQWMRASSDPNSAKLLDNFQDLELVKRPALNVKPIMLE